MEFEKYNNSSTVTLDRNIRRLLKSAHNPVPATACFKSGLQIQLEDELLRSSKSESLQQESPDAFEENLSRLLAAAGSLDIQTKAKPDFKESLRYEILAAGKAAQLQQRRLNVLTPALATPVVGLPT